MTSNWLKNSILQDYFVNKNTWVALYQTDPTEDNIGLEVTGGGYVRQAANWTLPLSQAITNDNEIRFPLATDNWGLVTHYGLLDDNNNLLAFNELAVHRDVVAGDEVVFRANALVIDN